MKYTINWIKQGQTSTGKLKADATLKGEDGVNVDVTIWGDFPNFSTLMNGGEVEGEIKPASDPKFKPSLSPSRTAQKAQGGGFKTMQIEKTMDRKENSIRGFQASKEESIKLAGAQRDAVLIVTTLLGVNGEGETDERIKEWIIRWRDWFLSSEFNETLPF